MSHYYTKSGEPMHFVPKKDGSGTRPTTIADARKLGLVPSVTTILKVLDRPALLEWKIKQAVYAVTTAPDRPGEGLDAKISRILDDSREQDQEAAQARDLGTRIHDGLEMLFTGSGTPSDDMMPWIAPAYEELASRGKLVAAERVLVGPGYAGRTDLIMDCGPERWVWDYKSTKTLPTKGAWQDHKLQGAAYANVVYGEIFQDPLAKVRTGNVYISTVEKGKFVVCENEDWYSTYREGFRPLLDYWYWSTGLQR